MFFDNIQVVHTRGAILEENHYYPFGMIMAGLSSKVAGGINNKYKYNGKELQNGEFSDGSGLESYDYGWRIQDPQIGRFSSVDPLSEKYNSVSPYCYVENNPISRIDLDGQDWIISRKEVDGKTIFNITMNGKVYNNSSYSYSNEDMEKIRSQMAFQIRTAFGMDNESIQVNMKVNLAVANSLDDIKGTDHVFQIVDDGKILGGIANGRIGGLNVRIEKKLADEIINSGSNTRTISHELGHTGGLDHPHGKTFGSNNSESSGFVDVPVSQRGKNLMSQSWYITTAGNIPGNSRQITKDQYEYMFHQYTNGRLNQNSPLKSKWIFISTGLPFPLPAKVKYLENKTE